jgi:aerobic carbon-monoxide dehydrogenase large subunit
VSVAKGRYFGQPVLRVEDERLLRGEGQFLDDIREPAGTLHLGFVRAPVPHAHIVGIDAAAARALPGVVAVFTGADVAQWAKDRVTPVGAGLPGMARPNMAVRRVRHVGESVAVVVATNAYVAEDAVELVNVEYEPLPAVVSIDDALAPDAVRVHEALPDNVVFRRAQKMEGTEQAFAAAAHVLSDTFVSTRLAAVPMETRGFIASFDRGQGTLTLWATTQMPHKLRWELADTLGLREQDVRIVLPDVGGGFGQKAQVYPEDVVGAAVSRHLGCPVKWVQDRQDDLMTSTHARDYRFDVDLAVGKDGTIQALRAKVAVNIGAYATWMSAGIEAGGAGQFMIGPYRIKHYDYDVCSVATHKSPVGVYRGVAAPVCAFTVETLLERAAAELGLDAVEIRRRNLLRPEDLPYPNAVGVTVDTVSHIECLDRALEMSNYAHFRKNHSGRVGADGKLRGIGLATIAEHTGQGSSRMRARGQSTRSPGFDGASMRMEPDGRVIAYVSHTTQGQGHLTAFAQLVAEELGLDMKDVTVLENDTALMPFGTGTVASRGAVSGGGAVLRASRKIGDKLRRVAGFLLEASPADIELANGKASITGVPGHAISVRELAECCYFVGSRPMPPGEAIGLDAVEFYDPVTSSYSNATHVAAVAIDPRSGQVKVEGYWVAHDCGRVINPMIVHGQVHGGIVQGLGEALMEAMEFSEEGQPLTTTLIDYVIPTALDVPDIQMVHLETPSKTTEGGMKGAGEGGVIGAVPAVALAVADALSTYKPRLTRLPLTPSMIVELMQSAP